MPDGVLNGQRCAFVGDEALVVQCAQIAQDHGLTISLLATASPLVRTFGADEGVPVVGHGAELVAGLEEHTADVLFSIANEQVVPDEAIDRVGLAVHLHDGPVPAYLGLNVTTWAILNGETEHAVTWQLLPGGEVVAAESVPIADDDTALSLNVRCYEAAVGSFPAIAAAVAGGELGGGRPVDGDGRTFTHRDRPAVLLNAAEPAADTVRAVRALDVGGRIANTAGAVRWVLDGAAYVVDAARESDAASGAEPGTLVALDDEGARIATTGGDLIISALSTPEGEPLEVAAVLGRHGVVPGHVVAAPSPSLLTAVAELEPVLADDEAHWLDRLAGSTPTTPVLSGAADAPRTSRTIDLPPGVDAPAAVAAVAVWLSRTTGSETVGFQVTDPRSRVVLERLAPLARPGVVTVPIVLADAFTDVRAGLAAELEAALGRAPLLRDAIGRDPRTRASASPWPVLVELEVGEAERASSLARGWAPDVALRVAVGAGALTVDAVTDPADPGAIDRAAEQLATMLAAAGNAPDTPCGALPVLGPAEAALLDAVNDTDVDHDRAATIDALFRAQVARTPDASALSSGATTLTYAELHERVQRLASRLVAAGVGRGHRVGIATERSIDMVVGVLATLEVGAAYLPLDPSYPADRLGFMVEDAGIAALLATGPGTDQLARPGVEVIDPAGSAVPAHPPAELPSPPHDASDLAYLIYTSGSTGVPKGVMLEHRQVANFFVAMDAVIDHDPPGVWLAVTSLSFDISVLELLWTLTRGFEVVLKSDSGIPASNAQDASVATVAGAARPVSFSMFYFAAGEGAAADGYRLLLESARFADRHGFEAVWTPERHFHAFGGAYPNPSVTGAALAAVTEHVGIRAGSVVLPLHSPIRVAEEWAVVDGLSGGRVAISFAAGWQPDDFVLNPSAYATAKEDLPRNIDAVRQLWRGETISLPGHDGRPVEVRTLPRPVQAELPVWLTSAGSPATFERAGTLGVNVLTHLLGQSVEQLSANVERYRAAWRAAGHPGQGQVTLMLHTYLHRDSDIAREVAREPMKSYLATAVGLIKNVATSFPIFADSGKDADELFASLSAEELDGLLEMVAQRYLGTSGLFGTPDDVAAVVEELSAAGVDEIACLVDFGIDTDEVLASLELLLEAKRSVDARRSGADPSNHGSHDIGSHDDSSRDEYDDSVAGLAARHGVTHLQCTPSLAAMLVADPSDRAALGTISHLMVGGEALPAALAAELRELLPGRFTNMYGPTETTIWSLVHEIPPSPGTSIPIGRPIANTAIFVLDAAGARVPAGTYGELHIGGEGVARGYHDRPELTAERFVDRPGMGRVYATGDVVRIHPQGYVEFAGRADNQVKIRGHRVELGEIELVLDQHPDVVQSVVVAREDRGTVRLVGYVIARGGAAVTSGALRQHVGDVLPAAMVPSAVVLLDAFPLTPNGKVDRKALPAADPEPGVAADAVTAPPVDDSEQLVADIWSAELGFPVGRDDNFFDIGGHSLLAVKVFRRLSEATNVSLALTDVFRYPTVRTFAAHLGAAAGSPAGAQPPRVAGPSGADRGAMRRRALTRRGRGPDEGGGP